MLHSEGVLRKFGGGHVYVNNSVTYDNFPAHQCPLSYKFRQNSQKHTSSFK